MHYNACNQSLHDYAGNHPVGMTCKKAIVLPGKCRERTKMKTMQHLNSADATLLAAHLMRVKMRKDVQICANVQMCKYAQMYKDV